MGLMNLITEGDNSTVCPVRVGSTIVGFLYHVAIVAGVYLEHLHLDMASLGQYIQHMMVLIGTMAAGIGAKSVLKGDAPK